MYVFTPKSIYVSMAAGKYESEEQETIAAHRSLELHILIETLNCQVVSLTSETGSNPLILIQPGGDTHKH